VLVEPRRQLESAPVEQVDELTQALARPGDHEIEIARNPLRSEHDQRHAADQRGLQPQGGQCRHHLADLLEMAALAHDRRRRPRNPGSRPPNSDMRSTGDGPPRSATTVSA